MGDEEMDSSGIGMPVAVDDGEQRRLGGHSSRSPGECVTETDGCRDFSSSSPDPHLSISSSSHPLQTLHPRYYSNSLPVMTTAQPNSKRVKVDPTVHPAPPAPSTLSLKPSSPPLPPASMPARPPSPSLLPPQDAVNEVLIQFRTPDGQPTGPPLSLPLTLSSRDLTPLINQLLSNPDPLPYAFYLSEEEISASLGDAIERVNASTEATLSIVYQPQSLFRVRAVTHCTASLPGHTAPILTLTFSPSSAYFITGAGDSTLRLWDASTSTPLHTLKGHTNWVLAAAFAPNERLIASASMDCTVRLWSRATGQPIAQPLRGHAKYVTCLAFEPLHLSPDCTRLASGGKDGAVKVWDLKTRTCALTLSGHTGGVTCIRWGGGGRVYSGSQDRTVKVWDPTTGQLLHTLTGHAHWVNCLSLSTDYALRLSGHDEKGKRPEGEAEFAAAAKARYDKALQATGGRELAVSGSEDFTCILWADGAAVVRMTGHQQPVNWVTFSPDSRLIASASFDKSVRVWRGVDGKFVCTMRGHVGAVYQVCWSSDSRLLCSSSKDSTMKVWDVNKRVMTMELPGHADEVYACDWSANGEQVASGGKDHLVKIWRN